MKYSQVNQGRIFVLRLEDGETVHEEIEKFAVEHAIQAAALIIVGGAGQGSSLVVGPESGETRPVNPMAHILEEAHEIAGTGTLFPDEEGTPLLHMHMACGRRDATVTGCIRNGVKVWQIMEVVLFEFVGVSGRRVLDDNLGFKLLIP
jgi:predicted DNA-binding protein with PD1-like motif